MTQFSLKIVALCSMLLDHLAKVVLSSGVLTDVLGYSTDLWLRTMMMAVGRLAFPIFAWFTAEGCKKTKHPGKYLLRMLMFAVLSEVPFQLCFYGAYSRGLSLACHNVIFTMLFAACAIFASKWLAQKRVPYAAAVLIPAVLVLALCWWQYTDYNAWGAALILLLYYMPNEKGRLITMASWVTVFILIWHGWSGQGFSWISGNNYGLLLQWLVEMLVVPLLATYNGEKGMDRPWGKWLFYVFYPAHLLILFLIRLWL